MVPIGFLTDGDHLLHLGVRRRAEAPPLLRPVTASLGVPDAAPPCYLAEPHHAALRQRELASHVT